MSRVDMAKRRAAELASRETAEGSPRIESPKPLSFSDAVGLTVDPFPFETPGGGRSLAVRPPPSRSLPHLQPGGTRLGADTLADAGTSSSESGTWPESLDAGLSHKVVGGAHMSPGSREQYRRLAATLHNANLSGGVKVIMVSSAVGGEGKSLTAANLALTFGESYHRRVLLVDADLRHPSLHLLFPQAPTSPSDHLVPHDQRTLPVTQVTPRLVVLTIGLPSSAPMAELTSERMDRLLQQARETFDWIVIDTPPVALLPDASLLASRVDGVVLVVKAGSTSLELVQRAVEAIGRSKMLGFVLNSARMPPSTHDYQYDEPRPLTRAASPMNRS